MKDIEITNIPPLSPGEQSLLDMHSVVNVMNVLRCELQVLGLTLVEDEDFLRIGIGVCDTMLASLEDHEAALQGAKSIDASEATILAELDCKLPVAFAKVHQAEVEEAIANIHTVFKILKVRAREILARAGAEEVWIVNDCETIKKEFAAVFAAIEKNSKGRYRILVNSPTHEPNAYYVRMSLDAGGGPMLMPAAFKDVMRDLIANARKYTAPGGEITASLTEDSHALRFVVEDNGRGIPESEIPHVAEFGKRGSNVGDVRTMGGGFGLTKAFMVTKQFGGRMWIASEVGVGTRIRIWVPTPTAEIELSSAALATTSTK